MHTRKLVWTNFLSVDEVSIEIEEVVLRNTFFFTFRPKLLKRPVKTLRLHLYAAFFVVADFFLDETVAVSE